MIDLPEYFKLLVALIAIIDVPGSIPIFLQQTARLSQTDQRITALSAGIATAMILTLFALLGQSLLGLFGITLAAFKILGGIVVLLIALDMLGLIGEPDSASEPRPGAQHPVAIGIFPLAVPLFAGPGAITAVMVFGVEEFSDHDVLHHDLVVLSVIAIAALTVGVGLTIATTLSRFIGPVTQIVLNRLLGMIVGALGVEFILEGLAEFFPALAA